MDVGIVKVPAQVFGIGGAALGVFLILYRDIIQKKIFPGLTRQQAYRLLTLIVVLVWSVALAGIVAWVWGTGHGRDGPAVTATDHSTIAITNNNGPTLEQIKEAAGNGEKMAKLGERLGVTDTALSVFFHILNEEKVPDEKLAETLMTIAERHKALLAQVRDLQSDDPEVRALREQATAAITAGRYDDAEAALARAESLPLEAAHRLQAAADRQLSGAAAIRAERGQLALTRLRYRDAAGHFAAAAATLPPGHDDQRLAYLDREADSLYRQGDEVGDNPALLAAIDRYRAILILRPRERVPLDWAMTQNNLGAALETLGERESGTAWLDEAVAAYRAALLERTRERVPLDWAATQNNLGNALRVLGERESGTARLDEAVAAYREVLLEYTRERVPLDWAMTQNNLGNALVRLGERESGTARLDEAVAAYRAALLERTRERVPLDWAATQNNLGTALETLGERESGTARLDEAVAACRAALLERTRERVPLDWAMTQNNLGDALRVLGERESGTARLEDALQAIQAAWKIYADAGYDRYRADFEDRIRGLEKAIADRTGGRSQPQERAGTP